MSLLIFFFVAIFVHSLVSGGLSRTVITPPIVFTTVGMAYLLFFPSLTKQEGAMQVLLHVAEIGLVLLLFTDASRTDLGGLKRNERLPLRLLSIGMLLTIFLGAVAARLVFPGLTIWEAGILAAILAPTDAGLGQVIVSSKRVPEKIREALNVEAGLNDGLSVPFLLFFIALASAGSQGEEASLVRYIVEQLGYGAAIGAAIGLVGGWLLGIANRRKWTEDQWQRLGVVALPLLCVFASEAADASMFIASFVAGLTVQVGFRNAGKHSVDFAEDWGELFSLFVFYTFGLLVPVSFEAISLQHVLYAILSLTVVRMLPVAIALVGTGLGRATVAFMGWFGPRGLASIVLGLVYVEQETHHPGDTIIHVTVIATVLLSIYAHGLTALPGIGLYARSRERSPQNAA